MLGKSVIEDSQELTQTSKQLVAGSNKLLAHCHQIRKESVDLIENSRAARHTRNDSDTHTDKTYYSKLQLNA